MSDASDTPAGAAMWDVVSSTVQWEGYSTVRVDTIRLPDGTTADREVVEHQSAVAVVPLTAAGEVILVRQYRHAFGTYLLELPAGGVDPDDADSRTAGERELVEEIGRHPGRMLHLTTYKNSVGWCTESTDIWLATDLVDRAPDPDWQPTGEEADMEVVVLGLDEAVAAVHDGTITDGKSIIGLLLAQAHLAAGD